MTITSGVRCEAFNSSIKGSLLSSHIPNEDGMGLSVDIACTTLGQGIVAQIGEIVLFANTVTMAMPTRRRENMVMDYISQILNYLAMNIGKNRNMDDI